MSETFVLDTVARFVGGTEDAELRISNAGTGTVYYDNERTVSSSSNDGSIAAGASATRRVPTWIAATTQTPVTITRKEHPEDSHNVHGYVGDLANLSVFESAPINVKHADYGAVGDGSADDTAAFLAAAAAVPEDGGSVFIPPGIYDLSAAVEFSVSNTNWIGAGRDATIILQNTNTEFAFAYQSPIEASAVELTGPTFSHMTIQARNGVDLNQSGDLTTVFEKQAFLYGVSFDHVFFLGNYPAQTDANRDTATVPTQSTVDAFGIGLRAAKCFDMHVGQGCTFSSLGVGARLDGCDISVFDQAVRFIGNARHLHLHSHDTYGAGVKLYACDMLVNRRAGGIHLLGTQAVRIRDSYFEAVAASGLYILSSNDTNTHLTGNRFADPIDGTPVKMLSFAPQYGLKVTDNNYEAGASPSGTVELLTTNADANKPLATWHSNGTLPTPTGLAQQQQSVTAATTTALPGSNSPHPLYMVSGATTIDNLSGGDIGQPLTLFFVDGATVRHAGGGTGNLRLNGSANFVAAAGDMLTVRPVYALGSLAYWEQSRRVG